MKQIMIKFEQDIDEIYCLSVNDSFVMNAWFDSLGIVWYKSLLMVMVTLLDKWVCLSQKEPVCFGYRSQRYSMVVDNGGIQNDFCRRRKRR